MGDRCDSGPSKGSGKALRPVGIEEVVEPIGLTGRACVPGAAIAGVGGSAAAGVATDAR